MHIHGLAMPRFARPFSQASNEWLVVSYQFMPLKRFIYVEYKVGGNREGGERVFITNKKTLSERKGSDSVPLA